MSNQIFCTFQEIELYIVYILCAEKKNNALKLDLRTIFWIIYSPVLTYSPELELKSENGNKKDFIRDKIKMKV